MSLEDNSEGTVAEGVVSQTEDNSTDTEEGTEPSLIEQQATSQGWREDGVEGKRNLSAEEFLDRKELYSEISSLKRGIKNRNDSNKALETQVQMLNTKVLKREKDEIRSKRREAIESGDTVSVDRFDDELDELKEDERKTVASTTPSQDNEVSPEVQDWASKNSWFESNKRMANYANAVMRDYETSDLSISQKLEEVTKEVQKTFPEEFTNKMKSAPAPVEPSKKSRTTTKSKSKYSWADVPEQDAKIGRTLTSGKNPTLTTEEWLESYFA